jgi:hypothetical protein
MNIFINDVEIDGELEELNKSDNHFNFYFKVVGVNNYHLYSNLLNSDKLKVSIPALELEFDAKKGPNSSSYRDPLNDDTEVDFSVEFKQSTEEETGWDLNTGLVSTAISNWARTRALAKALKDKGILSSEEYEQYIDDILASDREDMTEWILKGPKE